MEYVIFSAIIFVYFSISGQINKLKKRLDGKSKQIANTNLNELVGKNVVVYLDDEYHIKLKGTLISFDNKWFELKVDKKNNNTEIYYKRIEDIYSIILKD